MGFGMTSIDENNLFLVEIATILVERLERLSADSIWAHRASGVRGSLLRRMDEICIVREQGTDAPIIADENLGSLSHLVDIGFEFLEKAAKAY